MASTITQTIRTGSPITASVAHAGARGADGLPGEPGPPGEQGPPGADGAPGVAAAHAATHATGGDDALSPAAIGAATLAQVTAAVAAEASARDVAIGLAVAAGLNALLDGAPGALDTLNELAAAVNDDASFAASMTAALATKIAEGDARLTNARPPTAHAASHAEGGADALTLTLAQITGLVAALGGKAALAGATFTGPVSVPAPTDPAHAVTKAYADALDTGGGLAEIPVDVLRTGRNYTFVFPGTTRPADFFDALGLLGTFTVDEASPDSQNYGAPYNSRYWRFDVSAAGTFTVALSSGSGNMSARVYNNAGVGLGVAASPFTVNIAAAGTYWLELVNVDPHTASSRTVTLSGTVTLAAIDADAPSAAYLAIAEHRIAEQLSSGSIAAVSFLGIPQTYRDLRLVIRGGTTNSGTRQLIRVRCNNDVAANYRSEVVTAAGGVVTASEPAEQTGLAVGYLPALDAPAAAPGLIELIIPDYARATTRHKVATARGSLRESAAAGGITDVSASAVWLSTAAITRLDVTAVGGGNLAAGWVVTLYGRR